MMIGDRLWDISRPGLALLALYAVGWLIRRRGFLVVRNKFRKVVVSEQRQAME
jgi:hypothetical protein